MKALTTATILLCAATASAGGGGGGQQGRGQEEDRTLTATEMARYAAVYHPAVRACYFKHGRPVKTATGELAVHLVVHRDGYVREVKVDAEGIRGKALRTLEQCIRLEALGWHFPVRRDLTMAILPYYFLYLDIPGAGPQYSCWNPRGCPEKKPARPAKQTR